MSTILTLELVDILHWLKMVMWPREPNIWLQNILDYLGWAQRHFTGPLKGKREAEEEVR